RSVVPVRGTDRHAAGVSGPRVDICADRRRRADRLGGGAVPPGRGTAALGVGRAPARGAAEVGAGARGARRTGGGASLSPPAAARAGHRAAALGAAAPGGTRLPVPLP